MAKKKKGGKKKPPEGVPLEDIETIDMNIKELKNYAVKMGQMLNNVRSERNNLEIDRDKMLRNLVNVVCHRMMLSREIRRIDRELINKDNIFERIVAQKGNELVELRYRQVPQVYRSKNDLFTSSFEERKQLFIKQDQMFKDRIGLNSDYYKKYLELEKAFKAAKHKYLCDQMDIANENNIAKLMWLEKKYHKIQQKLDEGRGTEYVKGMKFMVNEKEAMLETIQKNHVSECVDILRSFEIIMKYNFSMISEMSKHYLKLKLNDTKVTQQLIRLKKKYDWYCSLIIDNEKELTVIRPVLLFHHHTKAADAMYSRKMKETEEETTNAKLEVELLEEFIKKDDELTNKLRQVVIGDLLHLRELQIKAHLFLMTLGTEINDMYTDRARIGKLALCPHVVPDTMSFEDLYKRYNCYRRSMIDIVERILKSRFSHLNSLGLWTEVTPRLPILPSANANSRTEPAKSKCPSYLEMGLPTLLRMPTHRTTPKIYDLIMSLPRVPTRTTTQHVLPHLRVQPAKMHVGSNKLP